MSCIWSRRVAFQLSSKCAAYRMNFFFLSFFAYYRSHITEISPKEDNTDTFPHGKSHPYPSPFRSGQRDELICRGFLCLLNDFSGMADFLARCRPCLLTRSTTVPFSVRLIFTHIALCFFISMYFFRCLRKSRKIAEKWMNVFTRKVLCIFNYTDYSVPDCSR